MLVQEWREDSKPKRREVIQDRGGHSYRKSRFGHVCDRCGIADTLREADQSICDLQRRINRTHIWTQNGSEWKCSRCGVVCADLRFPPYSKETCSVIRMRQALR